MKKFLLSLAAVALSVVSLSANKIYWDNNETNWSTVKAYCWNGGTQYFGTWSGKVVSDTETIDGKKYHYVEVSDASASIIFNNGSGTQTKNLSCKKDGVVYGKSNIDGTDAIGSIVNGHFVAGSDTPGGAKEFYLVGANSPLQWGFSKNKMTENNGVYTITVSNLKGEFKISTEGWGEQWSTKDMAMALDKEYTCVDGDGEGTGMGMASAVENATVTFTYATKAIKVTGNGGGDEPIVTPPTTDPVDDYSGYYVNLGGSFVGSDYWKGVKPTAAGLADLGTYTVGTESFKIKTWSQATNDTYYGTGAAVATGATVLPVSDESGCTMTIAGAAAGDQYSFTFDIPTATLTITKIGGGDEPIVDPTPSDAVTIKGDYNIAYSGTKEKVYYWGGVSKPEWSGIEMTTVKGSDGKDYKVAKVAEGTTNVIFNTNGDQNKTKDLSYTSEFVMDDNGATSTKVVFEAGDEPIVTPPTPSGDYPELVVVGTICDWNLANGVAMTRSENTYTATIGNVAKGDMIKIAVPGTSWTRSWGGEGVIDPELTDQVAPVTVGTAQNAWEGSSVNFYFASAVNGVKVTFVYSGEDTSVASTLTVTGTVIGEDPTPVTVEMPATLYVCGHIGEGNDGEWDPTKAVAMTKVGNTFVAEKVYICKAANNESGFFNFIEFNKSWNEGVGQRFGGKKADGDAILAFANGANTDSHLMVKEGDPGSYAVPGDQLYNIVADFENNMMVITKAESGVADITVEAAPAVYYNLQGVEVANPAAGIFIEVRGNKVRKVTIK